MKAHAPSSCRGSICLIPTPNVYCDTHFHRVQPDAGRLGDSRWIIAPSAGRVSVVPRPCAGFTREAATCERIEWS
jgi:hypothetical protein